MVDRIELRDDGIRLCLKLPVESCATLNGHGPARTSPSAERSPCKYAARVEMKLIIGGNLQQLKMILRL